ncbi:hypothetical protein BT67DRAFT_445726 [Trichocladium antarcticum]|uniref:RNase III domain-containing protein n=1 Tax=Trichocladium antarcticum TaxID=1450529 RepID=A0AAN6UCA0_9PEZI|nr:hypothetical protein BT67DRAFT_445726 [Trichocladium antarcticum]
MALNPSRSAFASTCTGLRRCSAPAHSVAHCRQLSSSAARNNDPFSVLTETVERQPQPVKRQPQPVERQAEFQQHERPRWSYTPERMKGPGFSLNIVKDPRRTIWRNNDDPAKVDAMYNRLLGTNGEKMLPDEIKWLAITHKSFDQGRRGFNTRLAYFGFGRLIVSLEATRNIMVMPALGAQDSPIQDPFNREPFQHPALANADKLSSRQPQDMVQKDKMAKLAIDVGLAEVIRWKPRMPENLDQSGITVVLNTAVFAIIGAISLQHGAETAHRVVRERILRRVGA